MKSLMRNWISVLCLLTGCCAGTYGQLTEHVKPQLKKGNKLYQEKKYKEAQQQYAEAVKKNPKSFTGLHNLGDALYHTGQYVPARQAMEASTKVTTDKRQQAAAYHNIGNTYLKEKNWEEAIKAYKQSLKYNPGDKETKYNLAYANAMLKKDDGGKNDKDQNKDQQDKDKQNKDKQDKDKDKDKQDKDQEQDKQDQNQPEQPQDKQDQRPQAQPSRLSQQQAENLLNALMQEEKKLQDKKNKDKGVPVKLGKDW